MIVPQTRLLLWVALGILPFLALAALVPESALPAGALIAAVTAVVLVDSARARRSLDGIRVEPPAVVRLSKDRDGTIELQVRNETRRAKRLRIGLALPREIRSTDEDVTTVLPAGAACARLAWRCTPLKRGHYRLENCYLESGSPWGFWSLRTRQPAGAELRVYPNLLTERKSVAGLFLNRGNFGAHAQRQVGKGRDFEKLRDYVHGDDFDEIHWKATAKRGRPVTKVFQIERTQEVYVVIDGSRLGARTMQRREPKADAPMAAAEDLRDPLDPAHSSSILERFVTAALVLGLAAEQQGDLFGLLTFSDRVQQFVRAKNGKAHYTACRDAIYALQPRIVTPDFDELCSFIRLRLRRRALLVFLTSLDDPVLAEGFVHSLDLVCRQHLVLVNMLQPPGAVPLFSDPNVASLEGIYRHLGGHILWHQLCELEKILQRRGVRFSLLANERLSAQLVAQYVDVKRRQLI
jgi:uncharacterized protein (DUF58 family)